MFFGSGECIPRALFSLLGSKVNCKGTSPVPLHTLGWVFDGNFVFWSRIVKNFPGGPGREIFV